MPVRFGIVLTVHDLIAGNCLFASISADKQKRNNLREDENK
jgi:hypothetical protein